MDREATLRPQGFGGYIDCWQELLPAEGQVLRLPLQGIQDGPFVRLPDGNDGSFDVILVESLAESLGNLERFVQAAAARLAPGGALPRFRDPIPG